MIFHVDELKFVAEEDIHGFPRVISSMTEATYFTKHGERHNRRWHQVLKLYQENMYQAYIQEKCSFFEHRSKSL